MNISISSFVIAIPEIYILVLAFLILLLGLFNKPENDNDKIIFFHKLYYLYLFTLASSIFLIYSMGVIYSSTFKGLFIVSPSIYIFKIVIISFTFILSMLSRKALLDIEFVKTEAIVISLFMLAGNLFLLSSNNLLSFYIALELVTICTYALIFIQKEVFVSSEAGLKYFILGSIATGFILYGISLIYGFTGYLDFIAIKSSIGDFYSNWIFIIGIVMLIIGISFKLSLAPFHMWTPDVYKGTTYYLVMVMSTVIKFSVLFIFIRIFWEVFPVIYNIWSPVIKILIVFSGVIGFILAINQHKIKGFIAYSSIANMSYVLLAMLNMSSSSLINIIIYVVIYGFSLLGFIGIIMSLKRNNEYIQDIYSLTGLATQRPYIAFAMVIFVLSMAGLPITAGFFAKVFILVSSLSAGLYSLSLIVALLSIVIMYYYFKIIKIIFFDKDVEAYYNYDLKKTSGTNITIFVLFVVTIGGIFFLKPLISYLESIITVI